MRTGVRMATRLPDHIFMEAEQSNDDRNVLLYIQEFRERLTESWQFAYENLKKGQLEM